MIGAEEENGKRKVRRIYLSFDLSKSKLHIIVGLLSEIFLPRGV